MLHMVFAMQSKQVSNVTDQVIESLPTQWGLQYSIQARMLPEICTTNAFTMLDMSHTWPYPFMN